MKNFTETVRAPGWRDPCWLKKKARLGGGGGDGDGDGDGGSRSGGGSSRSGSGGGCYSLPLESGGLCLSARQKSVLGAEIGRLFDIGGGERRSESAEEGGRPAESADGDREAALSLRWAGAARAAGQSSERRAVQKPAEQKPEPWPGQKAGRKPGQNPGAFSVPEGFCIERAGGGWEIRASSYSGFIYGLFALHRLLLAGAPFGGAHSSMHSSMHSSAPSQSIRMIDHWDNFDGTVERGYAGRSIFFESGAFRGDFGIVMEYARLLASAGINAVSINNVNVRREEARFVCRENIMEIKKIADVFRDYGIRLFLSASFAAPVIAGGLATADALRPEAAAWWSETARGIYAEIPDFGGFVVKADSEGEPGPFACGRGHDEGANGIARALAPFGGIVIWRCFVYDCEQDWRDRKKDRAMAAYDIFKALDGKFDDNVALQIKSGPIDFQIREPVAPLLGALGGTNQIVEFQITQEYTGQQVDLCFLAPMWKECLDFDTKCGSGGGGGRCVGSGGGSEGALVKDAIKSGSRNSFFSGAAGVGNVGMDPNWTGHKLAQANLYAFGRLAWDSSLAAEDIAREWIALSFELSEGGAGKLAEMLLTSRAAYEQYTVPLAAGFMCNPGKHYGPNVDGYEYDRWGTYHYADRNGVGRDRTRASGTGFARQYSDGRFAEYESLETCPDELLLFFHHVPYGHVLKSGKTLIQHIYDAHFDGHEKVEGYVRAWSGLRGEMDPETFGGALERLNAQLTSARNWRDQVNTYFYRKSGVKDEKGRLIHE